MAVKRGRAATPHERIDGVYREINKLREWWGKEMSDLQQAHRDHRKVMQDFDRRLVQEHSANTGLRTDLNSVEDCMHGIEKFVGYTHSYDRVRKTVEAPAADFTGFDLPNRVAPSELDFLIQLYEKAPWQSHKQILSIMKELKARRARDAQ